MVKYNNNNKVTVRMKMMIPHELMYWVIELLGSDLVWWLFQPNTQLIKKEKEVKVTMEKWKKKQKEKKRKRMIPRKKMDRN